jgi:DNA-binding response OmpR family regulator
MLPKVHGPEILRELREKGNATPVIILTAKDALEDRMKGLDMGADDYLVKPFFLGELISRLKALVRRSYHQMDSTIRVGNLFSTSQAMRFASQPCRLTLPEAL